MRKIRAQKLTKEMCEFVDANYKGNSWKTMAKIVSEKFGSEQTEAQMQNYYTKKGYNSGLTGRWYKGQPSPTKGRPMTEWASPEGLKRIRSAQYKKGNVPLNVKPIGAKQFYPKYRYVFIKVNSKWWENEARFVWRKYYDELDSGWSLIHLDGNWRNNDIANLYPIKNELKGIINSKYKLTTDVELNKTIIIAAQLTRELNRRKNASNKE